MRLAIDPPVIGHVNARIGEHFAKVAQCSLLAFVQRGKPSANFG